MKIALCHYIYNLYFRKVKEWAEEKEAFYFRPYRDKTEFRYESSTVGMNTLNRILPDKLCAKAGLARKMAHSLRVTCAPRLYQNFINEKQVRDRTGYKSNDFLRCEKPGTEQVLKASECLGVPSNLNLSKDNVALLNSDGAGVVETIQSECAFDEFKCDIPDLNVIFRCDMRRKSLKRRVVKTKALLILCLTIVTLPFTLKNKVFVDLSNILVFIMNKLTNILLKNAL